MPCERPRSRARALAAPAAVLAAAALWAWPSWAQTGACGELATDEERIACLEARVQALEEALARADGGEPEAAPVVPEPAPPAPEEAATAAEAAPAAAASAGPEPAARRGRLRLPSLPFIGGDREDDAPSAVAAAPAPSAPAAPASAPSSGPESFGAEQVAARAGERDMDPRDEEDEVLRARIVDFEELHRGRLVVALDNGQMWRQLDVDTRTVSLAEGEPVDVEIWRSGFGGYRMKIGDSRRIMRVERLR